MRQPPTPPPQIEGLQTYQTETGARAEFRAKGVLVCVTAPTQEAAVAACTAAASKLAWAGCLGSWPSARPEVCARP